MSNVCRAFWHSAWRHAWRCRFCVVNERMPDLKAWTDAGNAPLNCTYEDLSVLFCNSTHGHCDEYFNKAHALNRIRDEPALVGISSGVILGTSTTTSW